MRDEKEIQPLSFILHPLAFPAAFPLVLLIGLPGSGKSSLATRLSPFTLHPSPFTLTPHPSLLTPHPSSLIPHPSLPKIAIISTDAIRAQLFGDAAVQGPWLKVWHEVEKQFRQTVSQIADGTVQVAIYDATNVVRKQRREAIALARTCGFTHITGLWLNPPLWVCLERNQKRDRQVPVSTILDMHRCLMGAPPSLEEGMERLVEVREGNKK